MRKSTPPKRQPRPQRQARPRPQPQPRIPQRNPPRQRQPAPARGGNARASSSQTITLRGDINSHGIYNPTYRTYSFQPFGRSWWARFAHLYNKYRVNSIRVRYTPDLSAFASGSIAIAFDSSPFILPESARSFSDVSDNRSARVGSIREPLELVIGADKLNRLPWYVVDSDPSTVADSCCGNLYMALSGGNSGNQGAVQNYALGRISFLIDIEVSEPSSLNSVQAGLAFSARVLSAPGITVLEPTVTSTGDIGTFTVTAQGDPGHPDAAYIWSDERKRELKFEVDPDHTFPNQVSYRVAQGSFDTYFQWAQDVLEGSAATLSTFVKGATTYYRLTVLAGQVAKVLRASTARRTEL